MLCIACQQMFEHPVFLADDRWKPNCPVAEHDWSIPFPIPGRENQPMLHHSSVRALQESGKTCCLCFLIESTRKETWIDQGIDLQDRNLDEKPFESCWFLSSAASRPSSSQKDRLTLCFSYAQKRYGDSGPFDFSLRISRCVDINLAARLDPDLWEKFVQMEARTTSSERTFATLQWWLDNCRLRHSFWCKSSLTRPWLPTRLIDVEHEPKLVINRPGYPHSSPSYVALSHCWGTLPITRLELSTVAAFQKAIPITTLPTTFRDAILVTRRLKFKYLWIDSLCIIQDSKDDWRSESSVMDQVYMNSALTISALDSTDSQGGLFRQRDITRIQPCRASLRLDATEGREQIYLYPRRMMSVAEIDAGPLAQRAWAFQERLLSPRMVFFGRNQIFWECKASSAAETFPHEHRAWPVIHSSRWNSVKKKLPSTSDGAGPSQASGMHYRDWEAVVRFYSSTSLTHNTDKLIAISAIAKQYAVALGDEYVAGLWRRDLLRQMCWIKSGLRSDYNQHEEGSLQYQAPSWSWASLNSPTANHVLQFNGLKYEGSITDAEKVNIVGNTRGHTEVLDVNITPVGQDVTGPIARGVMTIRGPVIRGTFSSTVPEAAERGFTYFTRTSTPHISYRVSGDIDWDNNLRYGEILTFLKILSAEKHIYALVLKSVDNQVFTRVGLLCYLGPWTTGSPYNIFEYFSVEALEIE